VKLENQNILITSNEPWEGVWYSKHNYAYELARRNNVYFINAPPVWKIRNAFFGKIKEVIYCKGLTILDYPNILPLIHPTVNYFNNYLVSRLLKRFFKKKGISDYILWSFNPSVLYVPKLAGAKFSIFHCADSHWTKFYGTQHLCRHADMLFLISQYLAVEYESCRIPKFYLHHGISKDEFQLDKTHTLSLPGGLAEYGLYVGVIDERVDYELLEKAIRQHDEITFAFIGPLQFSSSNQIAKSIFVKKTYPNAIYLGEQPFKTLKYYIHLARFCISFMNKTHPGNTISHHKTLLYLAQGKPVFSYLFLEYAGNGNIMYMSETHEETLNQLNLFLKHGEDSSLQEERIKFAKEFTFENNLAKAERYINQIATGL
jgi:hypothetical protein